MCIRDRLYNGPIGDGGWTYMHDQGRLDVEKAFPGVTTMYVESVPEGPDSVRAMENFIRNGAKLIFATSFGYMDYVQEAAGRHQDTIFMHCSGFKRAHNVGVYFGRMYQSRYLTGLVAGSMTKKNVIGFVAAHPIPEVKMCIRDSSGTAGKPILGEIERANLTNAVIVVTRYFGGIKLGVRGLIEAYGQTAREAIKAAGVVRKVKGDVYKRQLLDGLTELPWVPFLRPLSGLE